MTDMTHDIVDEHGDNEHGSAAMHPVDVRVISSPGDQNDASEFAALFTVINPLGTEQAQQLIPQAPKRNSAVIVVLSPTAAANAYVLIGPRNVVQNGQGFRLYAGKQLTYHSVPELWMMPDGANPTTVSVMDEKYR